MVLRRRKHVIYSFNEIGTDALLLSGEGNWCSNVFRRRDLVLYCFRRIKLVQYCSQGEGNWCSTVLGIMAMGLYCTLENGSGAVPSLLVDSDES